MRFTAEQKFEEHQFVKYAKNYGIESLEGVVSRDLLAKITKEMANSGKFMLHKSEHSEPRMIKYSISATILSDSDIYEIKSILGLVESYLRKHVNPDEQPLILSKLDKVWEFIMGRDSFDKSKSYFSFVKFLQDNFEYHDNTLEGDEYMRNGRVFTEREVFKEWIKQNLKSAY